MIPGGASGKASGIGVGSPGRDDASGARWGSGEGAAIRPGVDRVEALDLARRFAREHVAVRAGPGQAYVGATGSEPAAEVRSNIIPDRPSPERALKDGKGF